MGFNKYEYICLFLMINYYYSNFKKSRSFQAIHELYIPNTFIVTNIVNTFQEIFHK